MRLFLIIVAALLLRLAALVLTWNVECLLDECFYAELGTRLAAGEGFQSHARHYWPPGYVAFLGTHLHWGWDWVEPRSHRSCSPPSWCRWSG